MVKYLNEAFDDSYTASLIGNSNNSLKKALNSRGIDLKQLKITPYNGDVSNRSPLWKQTIGDAINNGQILGFKFPSGYIYVAGGKNDDYMSRKDKYDSDSYNLMFYSQLSRQEVAKRAEPVIITVAPKAKKDRYVDPRYSMGYDGKPEYKGQRISPYYKPDSEYDWERQKYTDDSGNRRDRRDKSGYALQSLTNLKARLFKKYNNGDIDEQLFKRFKTVADNLRAAYNELSTLNFGDYIFDYDKDYAYGDNKHWETKNKTDHMTDLYRQAGRLLDDYKETMGEININRRYNNNDISGTVNRLDRINKDIKDLRSTISSLTDR